MVAVCLYFQVHQPWRLRNYSVFEVGENNNYFNQEKNKEIMLKVARKCYLPANRLMLDLIDRTNGEFKISYSITGVALEQFQEYCPEVLESFQDLVDTGHVELLDETYHHSLAFLYSKKEFQEQVQMHRQLMEDLFNYTPQIFRNTELVYNNNLGKSVEEMGYKGILAEGADHILGWRSPNYLYRPVKTNRIKLLLKNYRLLDDIAFRFSEQAWNEWPLTAEKFAHWVNSAEGDLVNLFMDYETFGEHQWASTGIFDFLKQLPEEILKNPESNFLKPSEVVDNFKTVGKLDVPHVTSWADVERDLSAWLGNSMQQSAIHNLYQLEEKVKNSNNKKLLKEWRRLQITDHFYYMCTKWFNDGDVHKYFNVYDRPHDAFITFMNILNDFRTRLQKPQECR